VVLRRESRWVHEGFCASIQSGATGTPSSQLNTPVRGSTVESLL
jgi:hypothetical protein